MSTLWILVANASTAKLYEAQRARLYKNNGHDDQNIKNIATFCHDESRQKASDLVSDKLGSYQFGDAGHGSFAEPTDPKLVEAERFAIELAEVLNQGRIEHAYEYLIIVAPAHFKGLLQKHLDTKLDKYIIETVKKDFTRFKGRELVHQLQAYL
ncbi:MAG: host attachment protein [Gammaproteobacteria bacterium]